MTKVTHTRKGFFELTVPKVREFRSLAAGTCGSRQAYRLERLRDHNLNRKQEAVRTGNGLWP